MKNFCLVITALLLLVCIAAGVCSAAAIAPASKEKFVAGWAFGDPEVEGEFDVAGNKWMKMNPEGVNITNTGGATTDTPYAEVLKYICYQTEMEIPLQLPAGTAAGAYIVRLLVCENWWADGELHRMTYNVELNGKTVDSEVSFPVNKGEWTIKEYEAKIGADGILTVYLTPGTGGGDDGNLILSGVEVLRK